MNRHPLVLLLAGFLLLAGCGTPAAKADFNAADVMFLQMMLPLHDQGLELTGLAKERAVRPAVRDLATELDALQRKESETMKEWLAEWGQPTAVDADPGAHEHHGGLHQTSPAEIAALGSTPDSDFDTAFLTLMTGHLHNSVELTRSEVDGGSHAGAKALATTIRESRAKEISRLLGLVG